MVTRGLPYICYCWGEQKSVFQLCLLKSILKSLLVIEIDNTRQILPQNLRLEDSVLRENANQLKIVES